MIEEFKIVIPGRPGRASQDYLLSGRLHRPEGPAAGLAVVCHGLFSAMASPKITLIAQTLAGLGLAAARFDCLGCGETGGRVEETTLTGRAGEIKSVLAWLQGRLGPDGPIVLVGSSFGGTASLLAGADLKAQGSPLAGVAAWSAPGDFPALREQFQNQGHRLMAPVFYQDLAGLDLAARLGRLFPVLLIHGQSDEVVPAAQAFFLQALLGRPSRLVLLPGADHRLTTPGALETALDETKTWMQRLGF